MQRAVLLIALGALLILGCAPGSDEPNYDVTVMMLPEGHPEAGRDAFAALGCATCHAVAWEPDLPTPVSPTPGPELGLDSAKLGSGSLATSIVAPSHSVAEAYRDEARGGASPMPDYASQLTVRQLADIVAFLRRQGMETQARTTSPR